MAGNCQHVFARWICEVLRSLCVDLRGFCVDLYSFCGENCGATGCKFLILFEGPTAAQFLRGFWKEPIYRASGGEGLAGVERHAGDGDVAVPHDAETFLSYASYLEFCAGSP